MTFAIGDRVVLLDTPHTREGGQVCKTGQVVGISFEQEDHGSHVGYAVMLDNVDRAHFVLPDGLILS